MIFFITVLQLNTIVKIKLRQYFQFLCDHNVMIHFPTEMGFAIRLN